METSEIDVLINDLYIQIKRNPGIERCLMAILSLDEDKRKETLKSLFRRNKDFINCLFDKFPDYICKFYPTIITIQDKVERYLNFGKSCEIYDIYIKILNLNLSENLSTISQEMREKLNNYYLKAIHRHLLDYQPRRFRDFYLIFIRYSWNTQEEKDSFRCFLFRNGVKNTDVLTFSKNVNFTFFDSE